MFRVIAGGLLAALLSASLVIADGSEDFVADVRLLNDTPDRIALALDRLDSHGIGDGLLDEAIYFTSQDELGLPRDVVHGLPVDLPGASVSIRDRSVAVEGTDAYGIVWEVHFSLDASAEEHVERTERRGRIALTLENGAALTRTRRPLDLVRDASDVVASQPLSIDAFQRVTSAVTTVVRPDLFLPAAEGSRCQSGGPGSTGCSQSCNVEAGGSGSGTIVSLALNAGQGQGCTVQCGSGHYSCCGCAVEVVNVGVVSVPLLVSRCVCVRE